MPIQYNSEGHVESVTANSANEARLIIHELNLKKNEYAATLQRIEEQLALARPKPRSASMSKIWGALGKRPSIASDEPWLRQLEERRTEAEEHIQIVNEHIQRIQDMIAERRKNG